MGRRCWPAWLRWRAVEGVQPDAVVANGPGPFQHFQGEPLTQPRPSVFGTDVEPLHLSDDRLQPTQGDTPRRLATVGGCQPQFAFGRGVAAWLPVEFLLEVLEAEVEGQ